MFRLLPRTFNARLTALEAAYLKIESTPAEKLLITTDTVGRVKTLFPRFSQEFLERASAFSKQGDASHTEDIAKAILEINTSHFIQVLNLGVIRRVYKASDRKYYQLDMDYTHMPAINTEKELLLWSGNITKGEAERMKNEGAIAMTNPSAAEVEDARKIFVDTTKEQIKAKEDFIKEQQDVIDIFPAIDDLIRDIWDEVEFKLRKLPAARKRNIARDYGVVYVTRNENNEEVVLEEELLAE